MHQPIILFVADRFRKNISVRWPYKYIHPINYSKSYKIKTFLILNVIFSAVNEDHQYWDITPVGAYYKITNSKNGPAMGISGESLENGAPLIQSSYSESDSQLWSLVDPGNGYFQIINKHSHKFIDINGVSTADGARAIQYTSTEGHNQQFSLEPDVITSQHEPPCKYTGNKLCSKSFFE